METNINVMKEFKFYQDQKVIHWERLHFTVNAENYAQALIRAKEVSQEDVANFIDDTLDISHIENIDDTSSLMSLAENEGSATLETYNDKGVFLADNTKAKPQSSESYTISSVSLEDLQELGFDTSEVTNTAMEQLVRKMDISDAYWSNLEYTAEKIGLKKLKKVTQ